MALLSNTTVYGTLSGSGIIYDLTSNSSLWASGYSLASGINTQTGNYATIANLASTGSTLDNKINSLSGNLTSTYSTILNLAFTGSTLDSKINSLSGWSASASNLASSGSTLDSKINSLSGWSASAANLASTGSNLNNSIISLSGLFTGFTGALDATFATDLQLYTTGSTLDNKINSLSGNLTANYATIINLASTGSTLNTKINNLSGYINSTSSNIVFTTGNQTISGNKSFAQDTTFGDSTQGDFLVISGNQFIVYGSGNFTSGLFVNGNAVLTGVNLSSYATVANLASTGSTLNNSIISLSGLFTGYTGALDATYATDLQLSNTGVTLNNTINSLSGTLTGNYATILNLASTGNTLNTRINSLSGTLTGNYLTTSSASSTYATITNLASTGSTLNSNINSLSGLFTGYTGTLDATFASDIQLANTGSTLVTSINSLSGTLTGNYVTKNNGQFTNRPTVNGTNILISGESIVSGDLTGFLPYPTINKLQGYKLDLSAAPADGQTLQWDNGTSSWKAGAIPAGGNGGGGRVYYFDFANRTGIAPTGGLPTTGDHALSLLGRDYAVGSGQAISNELDPRFVDRLLCSFVTASGDPAVTNIPAGLWDFNIWASVNSASTVQCSIRAQVNIYNPTNSTYRYLASTDDVYLYETDTIAQYILNATVPQTGIASNERIYVQLFGKKYTTNNRNITLYFDSYRPTHVHTTIPSVVGDGVVKVVNGVFQSPATGIFDADVDNNANIAQSKIANLSSDLTTLRTSGQTLDSKINSLSGWSTSAVNLALTGSTLNTKINNLSGYVTGITGTFGASVNSLNTYAVFTSGNQNISGNKTFVGYTGTTGYSSITFLNLSGTNLNINNTFTSGSLVQITQDSYGSQVVDTIATGVKLTRSQYQPWLYNPDNQDGYNDTPTNTLWNIDGWSDFSNLTTRNYVNFTVFNVYYYDPSSITSKQWVMKDTLNNAYYKFEFTSFDYFDDYYGNGGGGFSYKRTRLYPVNTYITGILNLQLGSNKLKGSINLETRPTVNSTPISLSGESLSSNLINKIIYNTGDQQYFSGSLSINNQLLFTSQCSGNITGYITGFGFTGNYTGNYEGGNWLGRTKITQNTVQLVESSFGNTYISKTPPTTATTIKGIAMSSDGKYQTITVGRKDWSNPSYNLNGYIYTSNDYGNTWIPKITDKVRCWREIAMSSDGKYQTVINGYTPGESYQYFYTSNDYGNTWIETGSYSNYASIAMSSDGKYQMTTDRYSTYKSPIISSDYGKNWTTLDPAIFGYTTANEKAICAINSDGQYQYFSAGKIWRSLNYGLTWQNIYSSINTANKAKSISTSSDGKYVIIGPVSGDIKISNDYGTSFLSRPIGGFWNSTAISDNGKYMVAGIGREPYDDYNSPPNPSTGGIYFSNNYGNTWQQKSTPSGIWNVAISSNGKYVTAVDTSRVGNSSSILLFKTDELIDGNLTINNNLTLPSGDFYSYNVTGVNSGEFGLIGWRNNKFVIGSQQSQSGILRDVVITGNNININGNLNVSGRIITPQQNKQFVYRPAVTGNAPQNGFIFYGANCTLTPKYVGTLRADACVSMTSSNYASTTDTYQSVSFWYGTGTAPAYSGNLVNFNSTRIGGHKTAPGAGSSFGLISNPVGASWVAEITGLNTGTQYWFDIGISGRVMQAQDVQIYIEEKY
jgi:hypothetical protein